MVVWLLDNRIGREESNHTTTVYAIVMKMLRDLKLNTLRTATSALKDRKEVNCKKDTKSIGPALRCIINAFNNYRKAEPALMPFHLQIEVIRSS